MACSEEVDWGLPKEEQQSEAEETDSYTYETISEHQESEENDTNPYTYESFSDSSDETGMDPAVTPRGKVQPGKSCDRQGNENPDSSAVPAASSKYKARPVKSIESEQSTSSRIGGSSDAMVPRRVFLRPNVET